MSDNFVFFYVGVAITVFVFCFVSLIRVEHKKDKKFKQMEQRLERIERTYVRKPEGQDEQRGL
ncbi:MAG: hypothetical protein OXF02_07425 [Simkaniaceae bacterium]|nr:hypothetical protein [Simkaniaceae bacterium]